MCLRGKRKGGYWVLQSGNPLVKRLKFCFITKMGSMVGGRGELKKQGRRAATSSFFPPPPLLYSPRISKHQSVYVCVCVEDRDVLVPTLQLKCLVNVCDPGDI